MNLSVELSWAGDIWGQLDPNTSRWNGVVAKVIEYLFFLPFNINLVLAFYVCIYNCSWNNLGLNMSYSCKSNISSTSTLRSTRCTHCLRLDTERQIWESGVFRSLTPGIHRFSQCLGSLDLGFR